MRNEAEVDINLSLLVQRRELLRDEGEWDREEGQWMGKRIPDMLYDVLMIYRSYVHYVLSDGSFHVYWSFSLSVCLFS